MVIEAGMESPVREVAQRQEIPIIELISDRECGAGAFRLKGGLAGRPRQGGLATSADIALILHTSGTTSRPKMVPLTQNNICTSALNVAASLALGAHSRCLNIMPLFHIHGLIGATLSTLATGGSVVCAPGCDPTRFFQWLKTLQPTWYTAVPTMHQALLAAVSGNEGIVRTSGLKFIRSSSASLPPRVMSELERVFSVPVIEAYGMTEAAHQMASNPLPPGTRKPGSVGLAAGPEVAVMDEGGSFLSPGARGEIVIRGPNVTGGYQKNPEANRTAFTDGWFRTGDQGYVDADGYLFLTGRLKEIINRGGEKISPSEVDEVILGHPAVLQAVTFAVPHRTLGEDVAAAVVLREEARCTRAEVRDFVSRRVATHKVPRHILVVDSIPKGPTGKLQRVGLAEALADQLDQKQVKPRDHFEKELARIWSNLFGRTNIGIHDNFFALGGDSLLTIQLVIEVERVFKKRITPIALVSASTIEQLARVIREDSGRNRSGDLVPFRSEGSKAPLFLVPQGARSVLSFAHLVRHLDEGVW